MTVFIFICSYVVVASCVKVGLLFLHRYNVSSGSSSGGSNALQDK